MPFDYDFSEKLKNIVRKLESKAPKRSEMLYKKVNQIINSDEFSIEHCKNLKHDLKSAKIIHINKNFVLTFRHNKEKNFILFLDFDHCDNTYKK